MKEISREIFLRNSWEFLGKKSPGNLIPKISQILGINFGEISKRSFLILLTLCDMIFKEEINYLQHCFNLSLLKKALKQLPNFEPDIWTIWLFYITWRTNLIFQKLESYSKRSFHISRVFKFITNGQKP